MKQPFDLKRPVFNKIKWLHIEHVVIIKFSLTCGILAAYVVPPPYNIVVGAAANMVWLWKKL